MDKRTFLTLALGAGLLLAPLTAIADDHHDQGQGQQGQHHSWNHTHWDSWSRQHRDLALDIQAHPERLRDHAYLARHHDLQVYVQQYPDVVQYYPVNPYPLIVVEGHSSGDWHRHHDGSWGY